MEETMTRALFIAVTVFISMITLSLVMLYYNTAKNVADVVSDRQDIAQSYDDVVTNFKVYNRKLNGVELRSLIRKYAKDNSVEINIKTISGESMEYADINNEWVDSNGIVKEEMLDIINPVWENRVTKTVDGNITRLDVDLDYHD